MRAAETAGVSKDVVTAEAERIRKKKYANARRQSERDAVRSLRNAVQPRSRALKYENPRSAAAEEGIVRLMYLDPALLDGTDLKPEEFSSPMLGRLYGILQEKAAQHGTLSLAVLSGSFSSEEVDHITALLQQPERLSNGAKAQRDYINIIRTEGRAQTVTNDADLLAILEQKRKNKGYGG